MLWYSYILLINILLNIYVLDKYHHDTEQIKVLIGYEPTISGIASGSKKVRPYKCMTIHVYLILGFYGASGSIGRLYAASVPPQDTTAGRAGLSQH